VLRVHGDPMATTFETPHLRVQPRRQGREGIMWTIVIIVLLVLLLTGGGYGYSRRGRR
jgi:hypothetical protein